MTNLLYGMILHYLKHVIHIYTSLMYVCKSYYICSSYHLLDQNVRNIDRRTKYPLSSIFRVIIKTDHRHQMSHTDIRSVN